MAILQFGPLLILLILFSLSVSSFSVTPVRRQKSLDTIKYLNQKGPYLGLITVYPPEENAFFATGAFEPDQEHPFVDLSGRRFRVGKLHGKRVIYVRCGIGMVNAAAATQQMLDLFNILGILHFGIAGSVNNSMSIGHVTVPKEFSHTGIWDWVNPNGKLENNDVAHIDIGNYNVPKGSGLNRLGRIGYSPEQFFSESGKPNTARDLVWFQTTKEWLQLAASLEVSSVDMESVSVVMTSLSNGFPVIVFRGLSDLAGGQRGQNSIDISGPLAALNAAKAAIQFVEKLPENAS